MKKVLAVSLAILMLISTFPVVNVFAANEEHAALTEAKEAPDVKIPSGYSFSFDWTDDSGKTYYCYESEPSEFGLINTLWFDENGNEVNDPATPFVPHDDGSEAKDGILPSAYDAREEGLITSVKNQRRTGTCWAHAAMSCMESSLIKQGFADNTIDLNEFYMVRYAQDGYIPGETDSRNDGKSYIGNEENPTFLDRGGNYDRVESVANSFTSPVLNEKYIFENDGSSVAPFAEELAEKLTFSERFDYDYVLDSCYLVNNDISKIKDAILKYSSVQGSYHSSTQYYTTGLYNYYNMTIPCAFYCPENLTTNHAITIVGWDDDFSVDNFRSECKPERNGAWLVKNSWGESFGNDGYFWMSYEDKSLGGFVVYNVTVKDEFENVYLYDGYFWNYSPYIPSSTAAANVFVAERNEYITKVYNGTASSTTKYSIYKLNEGYTSPADGELIYSYYGPTNGEKYIDVYGDIYLSEGDIFSVVFESSARCEGNNRGDGLANILYTSNNNESFYKDRNGQWHDAAAENYNNVIVRAITASEKTEDSYKVTFTCPGKKEIVAWSEGNTVELPSQHGYTYVFTHNGNEAFDGTNVTHDMYVEMHAYVTNGIAEEATPCTTDYKCVFCGKKMLPSVTLHNYSSSFTAPTCTAEGYTTYTCSVCGNSYIGEEKVQKIAHSFVATVTAPTESSFGYTTNICSVCSETTVSNYTAYSDIFGIEDTWRWMICGNVLYIEGEGDLPDYTSSVPAPWAEYKNEITEVYIGEGITKLGAYTFYNHSNLSEAHYPTTLYYLGSYCFGYCTSLETGVIPCDGIHTTSNYANYPFYGCTGMKKIVLSEGITYTFYTLYFSPYSTTNLKEIVLPSTLKNINTYTFQCTSGVEKITLSAENPYYKVVDGVLYSSDGKTLLLYPSGDSRVYFKVPSNVETIERYAFNFITGLKYLDLSESKVTLLNSSTIINTTSLTNVNLPSGLQALNEKAIKYRQRLNKMYIPGTVTNLATNALDLTNTVPTIYTDSSDNAIAQYCASNSIGCVTDHTSHNFSTVAYTQSATCKPGFIIKTCECGQFIAEEIASVGAHSWTEISRTEATCSAAGSVLYICNICNETKTEEIAKLNHSYNSVVTAPTCTEGGYTTYTCSACGNTYTANETTANGHTPDSGTVTKAATCIETGVKTFKCSVCGIVTGTEAIAKTNHSYNSVVTAPTCTEGGYTTYTCSVCGDTYTADETTANGHTPDSGTVTKAATCTETGVKTFKCSVCGVVTGTEAIAKLNHSYESVITAPTCTEGGYTTYTCLACGDTYTANETTANGHTPDNGTVTKAATCTETGVKTFKCSVCGIVTGTEAIAKTAHTEKTIGAVEATCSTNGYTGDIICSVCNTEISKGTVTDKKAHTEKVISGFAPTCTASGLSDGKICSVCGTVIEAQQTLNPIGHSYNVVINSATCTADGFTTHTCQNCGDSYVTDIVSATGHSSDNGTVTKQATCTATGVKTYKCTTCGAVLNTETVAKKEHSYQTITTEATCTKAGSKVTKCTVCSYVKSTETIPAKGHTEVISKQAKDPTCSKVGNTVEKKCSVCGTVTVASKSIPAYGHIDGNDDGVCDECGSAIAPAVDPKPCSCNCHKTGFMGFIWKIVNFFNKLFKKNPVCECGVKHY